MWSRKNDSWVSEREKIEAELKNITDEKDEYMKVGVELIELMQHSEIIYKNASAEKKRRLVELVSSNLLLGDGSIEYQIKKPFNMLVLNGFFKKWRERRDSNPRPPA
jgi:hypothetical protein